MSIELCCLPIEVKARDVDSRVYLAMQLAEHNYGCLLGRKSGVHRRMFSAQVPFLYITKGARINSAEFFDRIVHHQGKIIYLDEEGALYVDWNDFYDRTHPEILKNVELYFSWGTRQKKLLLSKCASIPADRIVVTGHPRFDLRKRRFQSVYQCGLTTSDDQRPVILINTNFGAYNNVVPLHDEIEFLEITSKRAHDHQFYFRKYHYEAVLVDYFTDLAAYLAKVFADHLVVLRPHPVEKLETYQQPLSKLENVLVSKDGTAHEWIVRSKAVIQHDCTTGIEARFFGTPVVSFQPISNDEVSVDIALRIGRIAKTREEVAAIVAKVGDYEPFSDQEHQVLGEYFANMYSDASEQVVATITTHFGVPAVSPQLTFRATDASHPTGNALKSLKRRFMPWGLWKAEATQQPSTFVRRSQQKFGSLERGELENLILRLRGADPSLPAMKIEQIEQDTFYLQRAAA